MNTTHRLTIAALALTTNWFDYPGGTNSPVIVPLGPHQNSVFYHLTWP